MFCTFLLGNVLRATTACTFSTSEPPKVVRTWCVLYIFTSKCASRHNGVHFFDISTAKNGPELRCFVHFDFEMCFAPQRRALFRHLNFQKWSGAEVFSTFWLANVLRATTGSAPAALASLLFDPPEPQIIGKTQCFATFLPFRASASSFFWLFLFSDLLSSNLSLLSASALLCFSSVHIVESLTSKTSFDNMYVEGVLILVDAIHFHSDHQWPEFSPQARAARDDHSEIWTRWMPSWLLGRGYHRVTRDFWGSCRMMLQHVQTPSVTLEYFRMRLVGGLEHELLNYFPIILGISSSQPTNSIIFQRGGLKPPTR